MRIEVPVKQVRSHPSPRLLRPFTYASRYRGTVSLRHGGNAYHRSNSSTEQSVSFFLFASELTTVPEQIHVVRALISESSSVLNSVDVVRVPVNTDKRPAHTGSFRMVELHFIGLPSQGHLILHSISSNRTQKWTRSMEVGGLRFTLLACLLCSKFHCSINDRIPVSAGNEDVVRELVGAGADVKKPNDKGLTPL